MEHIDEVTYDTVQREVAGFCPEGQTAEWDARGLERWLQELTGRKDVLGVEEGQDEGDVAETVKEFVDRCFAEKTERIGAEPMNALAAQVMLRVIDTRWMSYLQEMDYLKTGIGLRGFGQRDPLVEYKTEAYAAFAELVNTMYEDFLRTILRLEIVVRPAAPRRGTEDEPSELPRGPVLRPGRGGRRPRAPAASLPPRRTPPLPGRGPRAPTPAPPSRAPIA